MKSRFSITPATQLFLFGLLCLSFLTHAQLTTSPLPDPLIMEDGTPVTSAEMWNSSRRAETLDLFRTHVYGHTPAPLSPPTFEIWDSTASMMNDSATRKQITITVSGPLGDAEVRLLVFIPNDAPRPVPLFLFLNHRDESFTDPTRAAKSDFWPAEKVIARGYAIAAVQNVDLCWDGWWSFPTRHGLISKFNTAEDLLEDSWGTIAAWAFGGKLAMDYFERDPDIDERRVAVVGHSRGGKAALWCGAEDPRFALTISNNSGCSGAALARRTVGETLVAINTSFSHWMNTNYKNYSEREDSLPLDQHQLIALMAPRLVYVASGQKDGSADPYGEYLSCHYATSVYELLGRSGMPSVTMPAVDVPVQTAHIGYHVRTGGHGLTEYDWLRFMDYADIHLQDNPTSGPVLGFNPTVLMFSAKQTDASNPASQDVAISNVGQRETSLPALSAVSNKPWLTVSVAGDNRKITNSVNLASAPLGVEHATVTVSGSGIVSATYKVRLVHKAIPVFTRISLTPSGVSVPPSQNTTLSAVALDQDGEPMAPQPDFSWNVTGGGSINSSGVFTAGQITGGPHGVTVGATIGGVARQTTGEIMVERLVTRINAGGGTVSGGWDSQDPYVNSQAGNRTYGVRFSTDGVAYAGPPALYQTLRNYSSDGATGPVFTFPSSLVPNGNYTIRLHFAEPRYALLTSAAENRKMTVNVQGSDVLTDFSPAVAAGSCYRAYVWQGMVEVSDGNGMTIALTKGEGGDAFIQGIEIYALDGESGSRRLSRTAGRSIDIYRMGAGRLAIFVSHPGAHSFQLFSLRGAVIASGEAAGLQTYTVKTADLAAGVYLVRVVTPVGCVKRSVMITHHR